MLLKKLREDAKRIFRAGLKAVEPDQAVKRYVKVKEKILKIGQKKYNLDEINHIFVVGMGKAGFPMAKAIEEIIGDRISKGIVVVKYGYGGELKKIRILEASHPVPDEAGIKAAQKIANLVRNTDEKDLVICLISGGGSALLPAPVNGISLEEKQLTTELLLKCGASIQEINTIRKHLSWIKGGQLAKLIYPSSLQALILSDVVGDELDAIASGPTVPDSTTFDESWEIIKNYNIQSQLPESVIKHIKMGKEGMLPETPKKEDPIFKKVDNLIIGSNILALEAAKEEATKLGYNCLILSSSIQGEAREVVKVHAAIVKEISSSKNPVSAPACVLSGGETTVKVRGEGLGGRNLEFSLAASIQIKGMKNVLILSAASDGTDGPTDAAGAFTDGSTWSRAIDIGLNPQKFLNNNDSYHFFQQLGDLFITGPTNTNVMDIHILLVV
ncbi:glycerate kinase [Candidatus Aerophobetes bacterium]|nr:glycerate kinase [Candidatus Aerophobetes bacterium]